MIAVLDYGLGNIGSILNALAKLGVKAMIAKDPEEIFKSEALIFPGDGAAGQAMENLEKLKLMETIKEFIKSGKPFLGICLGMQILMDFSEEGRVKCLGIIKGDVRRFNNNLKVPQIGWNQLTIKQSNNETMKTLFINIPDGSNFYFINSYYCDPEDKSLITGTTEYGKEFCSMFVKENITGVQFHPEKSGEVGLKLLKNYFDNL